MRRTGTSVVSGHRHPSSRDKGCYSLSFSVSPFLYFFSSFLFLCILSVYFSKYLYFLHFCVFHSVNGVPTCLMVAAYNCEQAHTCLFVLVSVLLTLGAFLMWTFPCLLCIFRSFFWYISSFSCFLPNFFCFFFFFFGLEILSAVVFLASTKYYPQLSLHLRLFVSPSPSFCLIQNKFNLLHFPSFSIRFINCPLNWKHSSILLESSLELFHDLS